MTVDEALDQLDNEDLVALSWLSVFVAEHPDQVQKLFKQHEINYTGDPVDSINKIILLADAQGSWFTGSLEDVAKEAHYFSLGNIIPKVKGFLGNVAGAVSTVAAPVVTALTGNPIAGVAAQGLMSGVSNLFGGPKNTTPPPAAQQAAPADLSSQQAAQIAQNFAAVAKGEDKPVEESFYDKNKVMIWVGVGLALLALALVLYFHYKKKNKK